MWSAGCILFTMLVGETPFHSNYLNELIENICKAEINLNEPRWNKISNKAKDLINKLICKDPQLRIKPEEALCHPWFKEVTLTGEIERDQLKKNSNKLIRKRTLKNSLGQFNESREYKLKTICYMFGKEEIWKKNS